MFFERYGCTDCVWLVTDKTEVARLGKLASDAKYSENRICYNCDDIFSNRRSYPCVDQREGWIRINCRLIENFSDVVITFVSGGLRKGDRGVDAILDPL